MDPARQHHPIAAWASLSFFKIEMAAPSGEQSPAAPVSSPRLKRAIDVVASFALLVLSLPILLGCAILIKFHSPGPILFRQVRLGRSFRPFSMLKLRTMDSDAEGPVFTPAGDPRVTPIGRWVRRLKLDELPQFWNVLRGDMSLVGPRPVHPAIVQRFRPDYTRLLTVRPGLTDPATLQFVHEDEILSRSTDPLLCFFSIVTPAKLRIARHYLDQATLWTDCLVLAATVHTLLRTFLRTPLRILIRASTEGRLNGPSSNPFASRPANGAYIPDVLQRPRYSHQSSVPPLNPRPL